MAAKTPKWPVLTHYDQKHTRRIALPLGGIGTGSVSLGGRGDLHDWEIMSQARKGLSPESCFFTLYTQTAGTPAVARVLEGQIPHEDYEGAAGVGLANHGFPRFRNHSFDAAYPFGQVHLSDPDVPLNVTLKAFNPFIPSEADDSGIPMAVLRYELTNKTRKQVKASVCGNLQNIVGVDGGRIAGNGSYFDAKPIAGTRVNRFKDSKGLRGIMMDIKDLPRESLNYGSMAISSRTPGKTTHRTYWSNRGWNHHRWDFWRDLIEDGALDKGTAQDKKNPVGSLCIETTLAPRQTKTVEFMITWHFPNRGAWQAKPDEMGVPESSIGNYYTTQYRDAWDVAAKTCARLPALESKTAAFVSAFCTSDLPQAVKEGALNNLSTLRTQTVYRTPDGRMFGWEGCSDCVGCCHGSCTHVWNYEQSTAFLFGDLARSMRDVEFMHCTGRNGQMSFRVTLPLDQEKGKGPTAADGQMGCLMKLYRDWQLSGDDDMLAEMWPMAKKALSYCWLKGGWDADQDGVMEGCQHNTMDVEYHGPNPQMTGWYLGALRASEEMAKHMGEDAFANKCRSLFENGSAWMDRNLFNGDYYEHEIRLPRKNATFAPGVLMHKHFTSDWQLGGACLVDQLVGQFMSHVCGLGYLHKQSLVKKTLKSIYRYNYKKTMHNHMNTMRTYALQDESATLMASYPNGNQPNKPFPYFTEVMTGFEYTAAIGLLYEGETQKGLELISAIRDRYDGLKRNPYNEAECGHHYARAMIAWSAPFALNGYQYSAVTKTMCFSPIEGQHFWSTGYAWGTCKIAKRGDVWSIRIDVKHGKLPLKQLDLTGCGTHALPRAKTLRAGHTVSFRVVEE